MKKNERIPGEFVDTVTVSEVLVSAGLQLLHWANDIAFTDAAFGEAWSVEAANRMATLSELLNCVYKILPRRVLEHAVKLPDGVVGQIAINPNYEPEAEEPLSDDKGSTGKEGGSSNSIDEIPF